MRDRPPINGIGERTGNANLTSILPALQQKLGHRVVSDEQLARLTETSHFLDELLNRSPDPDQPYVGRNAFAHKGGMHVAGVKADVRTFEHMDPELVGNERDVVVSELSGKGTVKSRAEQAGLALEDEEAARALRALKEREHRGYQYEAAPASFELLLRRESGSYEPLFKLEGFRVITEKRATFSCTPGLDRPGNQTPLPGLVLAGDYTASDYPATLETAVQSGVAAATLIHAYGALPREKRRLSHAGGMDAPPSVS